MHEHGFNRVTAICERPQKLYGVAFVADACGGEVQRMREALYQLFTHCARQCEYLGRLGKLCVQAIPNLLQSERRLTAEKACNVFTRCVVKTCHSFSLEVFLCQLLVIEHAGTKNIET